MNFSQIPFGYFSFKMYGVFLVLAFLLSSTLYYKKLKKNNFSIDFFLHHYWRWLLWGLLFGRTIALLFDFQGIFERNGFLAPFAFWDGSFNLIGCILGFLWSMSHDLKQKQVDIFRWLDVSIKPLLVGILIMDIGGFVTGQIYGKETILLWGIQYETFSVDILNPIHPVTLYGFLLHTWLLLWARKHQHVWEQSPGKLTIRFGLLFFLFEFILHFFRGDPSLYVFNILRINQILLLFSVGAVFFIGHKIKKDTRH